MYISTNKEKKTFRTKDASSRIRQKFIYKYDLAKNLDENKDNEHYKSDRKKIKPFKTMDKEYNEDFLLSFYKRFDEIFKKLKGSEKIFEEIKNKNKKIVSQSVNMNIHAIYSRKLSHRKRRVAKQKRIEVAKIIEIQKIFKGHIIRSVNLNIDRLKLRQCLIELFCLLLLGSWCNSQLRYNFYLLKHYYVTAKLYAGEELNFMDKITFKLPSCYYSGTKINYLKSNRIGEKSNKDE